MRIYSKFHDYYDSVASLGQFDPAIPWKREERTVWRASEEFDWIGKLGGRGANYRGVRVSDVVIFCGKLHWSIVVAEKKKRPRSGESRDFNWSKPIWDDDPEPHCREWLAAQDFGFRKHNPRNRRAFQALRDDAKRDWSDLCVEMGTPIVRPRYWSHGQLRFDLDARLSDIGFANAVDPYQAYQRLERFVDTRFANVPPPEPIVSDEDKLAMRGFDERSFRKEPGRKKRRRRKNE